MRIAFGLFLLAVSALAGSLDTAGLQSKLAGLTVGFDGRVGVCAQDSRNAVCIRGNERFSMQSVMKLLVGAAFLDAAEQRGWNIDDQITVQRRDLSLFVQPIARLVTDDGYTTTFRDLVRRAIVDSDSAATDILIAKLGGPAQVQNFLRRKALRGIRLDRDEKHLQTEIMGLTWKPEYLDPAALDRAIKAVPKEQRDASFRAYQADPRDTATPAGMAALLHSLAAGRLLSRESTRTLLDFMDQTVTFPDRLKAGLAPGWTLGHKTGTSNTWNGVTAATNDVGIMKAPGGGFVALVVFIADSRASSADRAALMARIAATTIAHYREGM